MLEWGVRQGVAGSVIGDTDELVALTLAYQMLNDLTRSIDFALSNAERGTTAAGAADAANTSICQTRILTKGIEQLRDLREEVLRQRAQMRQSYLAALGAANLSANYAGLMRQRDRDARDAAGAAAAREQGDDDPPPSPRRACDRTSTRLNSRFRARRQLLYL